MDKTLKVPKPKSKNNFGFFKTFGVGKEKDYFIENLSLMLASEMPITVALLAMKEEIRSKKLLKIVAEMEADVSGGMHVWRAFEKTYLFPGYIISLIKIGEESGKLNENLKVISIQQAKDRLLKQRIRSAMLYPVIVFSLTLVIGTGIAWFILPRLASVFLNLRLKLPLPTRLLIAAGKFLSVWGYIAVPALIVFFILFFFLIFGNPKTKFLGQKFLFVLPGVKGLIQEVELTRFGYVMGTLLSAGIPVVQATDLLSEVSTFEVYKKFYSFCKLSLEEGNSLQKTFHSYKNSVKLIPVPVQQIVISGEQSGKLEQIFFSIAKNFEEKSENSTKNLTVILEPVLLVIVWLGVATIALAVILPIYNLIGGLQDGEVSSPPVSGNSSGARPAVPKPTLTATTTTSTLPSLASSTLPSVKGASALNFPQQILVLGNIKFLYVRAEPSVKAKTITKVFPGQTFNFIQHQDGWFLIILPDEKTGWVAGEYVAVQN